MLSSALRCLWDRAVLLSSAERFGLVASAEQFGKRAVMCSAAVAR